MTEQSLSEKELDRLASIESLLVEQQKHQKKLLLHTRLRTLCTLLCVAVLVFALFQVLSVVDTISQVDLLGMTDSIDELIDSSNQVMLAAEEMVRTANADLSGVLHSFSAIDIAQLNAGIQGIASVDFETLNTSIRTLSAVMQPLSVFFGSH